MLFAFSTLVGWSYYGETAIVYLLGARAAMPYRLAWLVFIYLGAVGSLHLVWDVADTLNGLMAIPNLDRGARARFRCCSGCSASSSGGAAHRRPRLPVHNREHSLGRPAS